jgi:glycosyltransferase involved in cell wall biosynthesis
VADSRRIVVVAPAAPHDPSPHAGGRYLLSVVRFAETLGPTTVLAANTPTSRAAATASGAPRDLHVVGSLRPAAMTDRAVNRVVWFADSWARRVDPGLPSLPLMLGLVRRGPARDALVQADVVDLQWAECVRSARLVRRLNPRARVVGTYHDVLSQAFSRYPARTLRERIRRAFIRHRAVRHERRAVRILDEVAVFSRTDADQIGAGPNVRVIHPPLATGRELKADSRQGPPTVVFVADLTRPENDDGAMWLLSEIWPAVAEALPGARLRLVGRGASQRLESMVGELDSVVTTGFVGDLDAEYAAASLAVVPLRRGAGVKFKTIEALLHGVPVVATPVGVEGIDGPDLFACVTDEPRVLASAMVRVLRDPAPILVRARAAQSWAVREYSQEEFERSVRQHYGIA